MNSLGRAIIAWGALLATGVIAALTGQLDWTLLGHPVAGERFPFVAGLAASAWMIGQMGRRTHLERVARDATLVAAGLALLTAPISFEHMSIGWLEHQLPVWGAHLGLCAQLTAWAAAARKTRGAEELGVWIMALGLGLEAMVVFPLAQLSDTDAACDAGMVMTCVAGSPEVAMALPALVTLALAFLWLGPLRDRLGRI